MLFKKHLRKSFSRASRAIPPKFPVKLYPKFVSRAARENTPQIPLSAKNEGKQKHRILALRILDEKIKTQKLLSQPWASSAISQLADRSTND